MASKTGWNCGLSCQWRTRAGAPWRDVPERYGPWDRIYDLFRRWQRDGTGSGSWKICRLRLTRRA
ncbi:transposase [Streptomyces sp. V4I2]|uniref:transposase n=1 Tax=Streptomyces sp. V4I2 TaxID=3042280 RepID=UPI002786C23C|nr:transposase [Streptomyces sp. V4I2]